MLKTELFDCAINKKCCSVDGGRDICPLFSSPPRGIWQLKSPHPWEFAIQGKKNANAGGRGELGTGGISRRADEIKLWLTPSAKQHRNPCSGLPAVYPDLSTRHDWPVKKGLCFVCRDRQSGWRGIQNALPVIRWVRWGSRTRIFALLCRRY